MNNLIAELQIMRLSMQTMRKQIHKSKIQINDLQRELDIVTAETLNDDLTGLFNRKGFLKAFKESMLSPIPETEALPSLIMIDIDHFKKVNDTHGHLMGDKVIKFIAKILSSQIKVHDTASRFGGEEFIVLLPDTSLNSTQKIAENIRNKVEKSHFRSANGLTSIGQITISIGIAKYLPNETIESFIDRADAALYSSKQNGRNCVTVGRSTNELEAH